MTIARRPTLHDVARAAGVSHQTVSRVLNRSGYTSDAVRSRVGAAIDAVGYRRNTAARALVTNRASAIGVLMPTEPGVGVQGKAAAVEVAARSRGYASLVTTADPDDARDLHAGLDRLLNQSIAGLVVLIAHERTRDLIAPPLGLPHVLMSSEVLEEMPAAGAGADALEEQGARLAVEHLVALGHRRILHLAGPDGWISAATRRRAHRRVLEEAGLPVPAPVRAGWTAAEGYRAARDVLPVDDATAVFAANDLVALGVLRACHELGIRVPEDLSVVGYDDLPQSAFTRPALTTVAKHEGELGRRAFELLARRIAGEPEPEPEPERAAAPRPVVAELIVRESTGPLR